MNLVMRFCSNIVGNWQTFCREKVTIPPEKPFIYLEGADRSNTVITFDDHQQTDTSATFTSYPPNIIARGITFEVLQLL